MEQLSNRAKHFLDSKKRKSLGLSRDEIIKVFISNGIEPYDSLIDFELNFGGYIFYAGLAPIKFGLIRGGGFPFKKRLATIEIEDSDEQDHQYDFICASTDYQMTYSLDENGVYYEDYDKTHSSFYKLVEELAIWEEMKSYSNNKILLRNAPINSDDFIERFCQNKFEEASDDYVDWYFNDGLYLKISNQELTLIGKESHKLITNIKLKVANKK